MTRLALLPLDDRPPTWWFPQRIAAIAGLELALPPRPLLGKFLDPGDCPALADWLAETAPAVDGLLVAADMLAYGGLIASRRVTVPPETALQRIDCLTSIRRRFPDLPIQVASVIMRISITAGSAAQEGVYRDIIRFSELDDLVHRQGRADLQARLEEVRARIPAPALAEYQAARRRNHTVNRSLVELRASGVLTDLILLQEDASTAGPHLAEQRALADLAAELGLAGQVPIYPGADEGTQTLLARWMHRERREPLRVAYTTAWGADQPAPFEDRPLRETTLAHLRSAGFDPVQQGDAPLLWVHTPSTDAEVATAVERLAAHLAAGETLAVADVCVPNGSDPRLMQGLLERGVLDHLAAYAGWNTAGNTLGTVLAHLSAYNAAQRAGWPDEARRAQAAFRWERYLDDWGYQAVVRQAVEARCAAEGIDPLNLGDHWSVVEGWAREALGEWVAATFAGSPPGVRLQLPWPRTFEAEVQVG